MLVDEIIADATNMMTSTPILSKIDSVGSVNGEYLVTAIYVLTHCRLREGIEKNMEKEAMSCCPG